MNVEHDKSRPFANDPNSPEPEQKQYGLWQVCPKCHGEGEIRVIRLDGEKLVITPVCPVCNGEKKLVRPEIKPGE